MRQVFRCPGCQYKSNRQYNVLRHERRIHTKIQSKICCGELLSTKADYYAHCELYHPQARAHTHVSRDKYKITADSLPFDSFHRKQEKENTQKGRRMYNLRVRRKYTGSFRTNRKQRKLNSKLSLEYSLTYNGVDMEDIPLIWFIKNQEASDSRKLAVSNDCAVEDDKTNEKAKETLNTPLPLEPSTKSDSLSELNRFDFQREFKKGIQSAVQANLQNEEQVETASEPTSPVSPTALPTKKLILHRFKRSFEHEYKVNLCDVNNNCEEMNIRQTSSESVTRLVQTVKSKANKENVGSFEFSVEQELSINLDQSVTVPLTTQLHRDFLGMIDFESYKIF